MQPCVKYNIHHFWYPYVLKFHGIVIYNNIAMLKLFLNKCIFTIVIVFYKFNNFDPEIYICKRQYFWPLSIVMLP